MDVWTAATASVLFLSVALVSAAWAITSAARAHALVHDVDGSDPPAPAVQHTETGIMVSGGDPRATALLMSHWWEGWERSIRLQALLDQNEREWARQRDLARRNYSQGYDDAVNGRMNRYTEIEEQDDHHARALTTMRNTEWYRQAYRQYEATANPWGYTPVYTPVHAAWCPALAADDKGKPYPCACHNRPA